MRIRIQEIVNPGSGMERILSEINIPDPQHWIIVSYLQRCSGVTWSVPSSCSTRPSRSPTQSWKWLTSSAYGTPPLRRSTSPPSWVSPCPASDSWASSRVLGTSSLVMTQIPALVVTHRDAFIHAQRLAPVRYLPPVFLIERLFCISNIPVKKNHSICFVFCCVCIGFLVPELKIKFYFYANRFVVHIMERLEWRWMDPRRTDIPPPFPGAWNSWLGNCRRRLFLRSRKQGWL